MQVSLKQQLQGRRGRDLLTALLMGGPAFLLLTIFMIWPFFRGIEVSTTNQRFDGATAARLDPFYLYYDRVLSVNVIKLPEVPDDVPYRSPAAGWYRERTAACSQCESANECSMTDEDNAACQAVCGSICAQGDLIFRWRGRNLEEVGLEEYSEYEIARTVSLGGSHYAIIAKDPLFWKGLLNNFYFAAIVVPGQTALALLLAILVNQKLPLRNVFRTLYFSPVVTAMVIIAVVWKFLYNPEFGLINEMIQFVTAGRVEGFDWLQSPSMAMPAIIIMSIWQGVGFQMIVFLAGLQDIPEDLYEASSIDGASVWQQFRFITLPMLRNTTIFVVLTTTILAFRLFDQVNVMTPDGGPEESTATMVWYAIRRGWTQGEVGYASAISVVFVAIVLVISIIQRVVVRSESAVD
ncbi:MAG: sugar ABC transporter permease [Chloroflexi bacterium]|nr:sugar ABC transporter permease [Chloroflexota bacterium]